MLAKEKKNNLDGLNMFTPELDIATIIHTFQIEWILKTSARPCCGVVFQPQRASIIISLGPGTLDVETV